MAESMAAVAPDGDDLEQWLAKAKTDPRFKRINSIVEASYALDEILLDDQEATISYSVR